MDEPKTEPLKTDSEASAVESSDLLAQINTLKDQIGLHKDLLREWQKWVDMGIEDLLPKWCAPVLKDTYEKTRTLLEG